MSVVSNNLEIELQPLKIMFHKIKCPEITVGLSFHRTFKQPQMQLTSHSFSLRTVLTLLSSQPEGFIKGTNTRNWGQDSGQGAKQMCLLWSHCNLGFLQDTSAFFALEFTCLSNCQDIRGHLGARDGETRFESSSSQCRGDFTKCHFLGKMPMSFFDCKTIFSNSPHQCGVTEDPHEWLLSQRLRGRNCLGRGRKFQNSIFHRGSPLMSPG